MTDLIVETDIWEGILDSIKNKLNNETFETWFRSIGFQGIETSRSVIRLRAPNELVRGWIASNFTSVVDQSLSELGLTGYSVEWSLAKDSDPLTLQTGKGEPVRDFVSPVDRTESRGPNLGYPSTQRAESIPLHSGLPKAVEVPVFDPALNLKYSYDSFVVGSCNQFAHAASLAVAEAPGKTYNPLYLYGGVGLGKTHLMHACGHAIKQRNPHLKLCYLSSEKFMNELINAIRYDKTPAFRERYRTVDVLLIDDVQFMAGKERTQEEFFHTFNSLYDQQKQIVISSDCPPREIPTLEERLHSRFEWGLIADIEPPDLETKVAILRRKAEIMGVSIPDDVALMIASRVKHNVRELEGSLIRLVAISSLRGEKISKSLAQDALRNIAGDEESDVITIEQIQKAVAGSFKISVVDLVSKSNARQVSHPRQIAMYLCKLLTKSSYPAIGRAFGGKHHTTVMHSFSKVESQRLRDSQLQKLIDDLSQGLKK